MLWPIHVDELADGLVSKRFASHACDVQNMKSGEAAVFVPEDIDKPSSSEFTSSKVVDSCTRDSSFGSKSKHRGEGSYIAVEALLASGTKVLDLDRALKMTLVMAGTTCSGTTSICECNYGWAMLL